MSRFEDGSYGSLTGVTLIGKVLAGRCGMRYTKAAVGSGTVPDGMTPKTMLGPAGYVMDARIAAVTNPIDGECQVTVQIKSGDVASGFYVTNIVLFAEDPDEGEVPYTYLLLENEPEWIRPASSIVGKLATFDLIAAVGDVDTVLAAIDPEAIATVGEVSQMLTDHNLNPDAHGGIERMLDEIRTAAVIGDIDVGLCTDTGQDLVTETDKRLMANRRFNGFSIEKPDVSEVLRQEIVATVALHDYSQSSHPNYLIAD